MRYTSWHKVRAWKHRPLWPNVTSSIKLEVHNASQRCQRRNEPRQQGICSQNFVRIGPSVPEICSRTDRHTDRRTHTHRRVDHNTPHPYNRSGVINVNNCRYTIPLGFFVYNLINICTSTLTKLADCAVFVHCVTPAMTELLRYRLSNITIITRHVTKKIQHDKFNCALILICCFACSFTSFAQPKLQIRWQPSIHL